MTTLSTQIVEPSNPNPKDHLRKLANAINNILRGKTNNTGSVTLTANAASTALVDSRIGINSVISLQPTTANAAAAVTTTYFGTPGEGTVTINHANNAQTDKTFKYVISG